MRGPRLTRRRFLAGILLGAPTAAVVDAVALEPRWVKTRRLRLTADAPTLRLVHITDAHHKGNRAHLMSVVSRINALGPDLVCFTGDLVEEGRGLRDLPEALEILGGIKAPLYGVPGNHDYWSLAPFDRIARCFSATGGAWLVDERAVTRDGKVTIIGATCRSFKKEVFRANPATGNLLLMHYPSWVEKLGGCKFDLILAGHSHGGQVRIPFWGPVHVPFGVGRYDQGLFSTPAGPLYVNPGLGWFPWPIRFNCRPEITLIEL